MTVMIATMSLENKNEEETISTARFAQRCQKLINHISINEQKDLATVIKQLKAQNIALSL